jgi:hypothetical protein
MNTQNVKKGLITVMAGLVIASIMITPSAMAFTPSFTDPTSVDLSVSGSTSPLKPGDTVVFTVSLTLNTYLYGNAHVRIWLNTSSQATIYLVDQDLMAYRNWTAGSSFNQPYTVVIPSDAANNNYVYATVDVNSINSKRFPNLIVALIQNPTYSGLQTQNVQLQATLTSLGAKSRVFKTNLKLQRQTAQTCKTS